MEAIISFTFYDFKNETEKEIIVDATKVIKTVSSEIDKYLEKTNTSIYGDEEFFHTTYYKGSAEIDVQIKYNGECFSVSEFEDFTNNVFKHLSETDYPDYDPDEET